MLFDSPSLLTGMLLITIIFSLTIFSYGEDKLSFSLGGLLFVWGVNDL